MHALFTLTTTLLTLSLPHATPAAALPALAPLEAQLISLSAAASHNTSTAALHHIFQTLSLLSKAETAALQAAKTVAAHPLLPHSHQDNHTHIPADASVRAAETLCRWLADEHRSVVWDVELRAGRTVSGGNGTVETMGGREMAPVDIVAGAQTDAAAADHENYAQCLHHATKGLTDARALAHKLLALQKSAAALNALHNTGAGAQSGQEQEAAISARRLKFWIFADWWVEYVCRWQPGWCHEEEDD